MNTPPTPPPPPPSKVPTPRTSAAGRRRFQLPSPGGGGSFRGRSSYDNGGDFEKDVSQRSLRSDTDYEDYSDVCPMEETPLVAHGSRKKTSYNNNGGAVSSGNGGVVGAGSIFRDGSQNGAAGNNSVGMMGDGMPSSPAHQHSTFKPQYSAIPESNSKEERSTAGSRTTTDADDDDDADSLMGHPSDNYNCNDNDDDRSVATTDSVSSFSTVSSLAENFRDSLMIPFTDEEGSRSNVISGLAALGVVGTTMGLILPKNVALLQSPYPWYAYISNIIGYNYFLIWSICFYPNAMLNYRRKSTKGLSNDFAILNLMGWTFYALYLSSMYFDREIRELYEERFHENSSVASNDVAFALHAALLSLFYICQIVYYGRFYHSGKIASSNHKKKVNKKESLFHLKPQTWFLVLGMGIPAVMMPALIMLNIISSRLWLDYFYVLSFFKICCTLTKYTKQVFYNYKRQSTAGWNIWYNFLECTGGTLSMLQIVLDSIVMDNMSGITGNLAKFLLGFATIFFDFMFFMQHYVWYAEPEEEYDDEENDDDAVDDDEENKNNKQKSGRRRKRIPKHIRASSRFEIVIPANTTIHQHSGEQYNTHVSTQNGYQQHSMLHAHSELSLSFDESREDQLMS